MKKDVIYIDIEDDITSIIEKVKGAKAGVIALVPPKRAGVLQSAVNLKLLQKAANTDKKHIVLITSDHSLVTLAAGIKMPVAKNLQSKPEIAPIAALEIDDEDIINGNDLPVGDLARTVPKTPEEIADEQAAMALSAVEADELPGKKANNVPADKKNRKTPKGMKVPDFDRFRKWLLIGGGLFILLIGFLVWANIYAPKATVTITAKTTKTNIEIPLTFDLAGATKIDQNVFKPVVHEVKKTQSVEFSATGQKEVGEKAKGRVTFSNCETPQAQNIPAGTVITVDGNSYRTTAGVTVSGGQGDFIQGCTQPGQSGQVGVEAAQIGPASNTSSGTRFDVAGHGDQLYATASTDVSGGSKRTIQVVTAEDVTKAKAQLKDQDKNAAREELKKKFDDSTVVVNESFMVKPGEAVSSPAIDQEASKAQLTLETAYSLYGLKRTEVKALLDRFLNDQIDGREDQQIYDNGENNLGFNSFNGTSVTLSTTGYTGPKIEEKQLKKDIVGKRYGEIQGMVGSIDGVEDVHTDFWPFWVTTAPSADKITIKFVINSKENE